MPWTLASPVSTGDLDTTTYSEVKIVRQAHDSVRGLIVIDIEYGNTVNGQWVPGLQPRSKPTSIVIQGDDYSSFISTNVIVYDQVKNLLYSLLRDKSVIGAGSVG